ncbi:signal peptidase I [Peribacillus deserti]|uniref:Signal peptidase I n=1 Tax=Peribacillus deserti TaxID=673318 RepID=A0ABS2QI41_9BACI|nr:signal peptidase I [Peribacillus deserti]MBM7692826.1 signal peptidase I [Peribacillus deserti]
MERNINKEIMSWIKSILLAAAIAFVCRQFLFSPVTVYGESMSPTFKDKNRIIVTKVSKIQHFDNVVFLAPDAEEHYIKRVIGLPGDTVQVKDDILYINGRKYEEPYLKENKENVPPDLKLTGNFTLEEVTGKAKVPAGCLFVMGDNRLNSSDSRRFGFIEKNSVIGEVVFRFLPIDVLGKPE